MKAHRGGGGALDIRRALREVIDMEARALGRLRDSVDGAYTRAVQALAACRGKVIVTGTGKSGLIAQKIAATLSSTGTPALHLHPSEGMHGDLGLVQRQDLVLAIGKSGESEELNAILPSLRRIGVKIIALTANPDSTLSRGADLTLLTPIDKEACPLNLAPTCSTTAALAAGDALAIALMKLRRFRREHFAMLHPAGALGKRLTLTVADVMRSGRENATVRETATISQMLIEMTRKQTGAVSVVDRRGQLLGLVTDFDVRHVLEKGQDLHAKSIRDIMNPRPTTVRSDLLALEAMELMSVRKKPFFLLPVVDRRGRAVGILNMHDLRARGL